ncbi:dihydropteroate synthase [Enterococcus timonensis]|uniref:dihydropteroate synthase n=1 Tax=Enterococcus timonensis TaxID=1852364 RepID=UPI0008D9CF86|nr:dihydropteroate synthase [Enterococcus timonensis]
MNFKQPNQIMGIVNVTPDSFSDGGQFISAEKAVEHAQQLIIQGADYLDLGGQSTRPGYEEIDEEIELARVLPVLKKIRAKTTLPISIDTYFPKVAEACLAEGADIINDIHGLENPAMIEVLKKFPEANVVVMHSKKRRNLPLVDDLQQFFAAKKELLLANEIDLARVCFDPGVGFGKTVAENIFLMQQPNLFRVDDFPLLYGVSRKRTIGVMSGEKIAENRDVASVTAALFLLNQGVEIVRVHNVLAMKQAIDVWQQLNN